MKEVEKERGVKKMKEKGRKKVQRATVGSSSDIEVGGDQSTAAAEVEKITAEKRTGRHTG